MLLRFLPPSSAPEEGYTCKIFFLNLTPRYFFLFQFIVYEDMGKYTYRPSKEEIQRVIIKLRWNGQTDPERIVGIRSYRQIADITGKSITYCRLVALNHLQSLKKSPEPW